MESASRLPAGRRLPWFVTMSSAHVNVRPYTPQDRVACLAVFDGNTPDYFAPFERTEFATYLDTASVNYLVLETAGEIIGCGGYYVKSAGVAGLAWGMVDRAWHKRGFGRILLEARLALLRRSSDAELVHVNTSQNSRGFFESFALCPVGMRRVLIAWS